MERKRGRDEAIDEAVTSVKSEMEADFRQREKKLRNELRESQSQLKKQHEEVAKRSSLCLSLPMCVPSKALCMRLRTELFA